MLLIRFIDRFTFCIAATGINKGACHSDVACRPFKWPGSVGCGCPVLWRNLL